MRYTGPDYCSFTRNKQRRLLLASREVSQSTRLTMRWRVLTVLCAAYGVSYTGKVKMPTVPHASRLTVKGQKELLYQKHQSHYIYMQDNRLLKDTSGQRVWHMTDHVQRTRRPYNGKVLIQFCIIGFMINKVVCDQLIESPCPITDIFHSVRITTYGSGRSLLFAL